jgi:ATP-dependent Clp protease ATP-binding subunit ClpX
MRNSDAKCAFCGKSYTDAKRLIKGLNDICICNECIELCNELIEEEKQQYNDLLIESIPTPSQIKAYLDQHVISQEDAKITLAVAVYNHYKRINSKIKDDIEIQKSNILMLGATGTGKTELSRTIAKMLKVPFAIADATTLTEAGFVGEDVENILLRLIEAADGDVEKAERGIVYLDEIDKISRKSENPSITRDVNGEGVQHALLKIIEGTIARVPPQGGRKHPTQECIVMNTNNILFICGGAFDGLEKILQNKNKKEKTMGFGAEIATNKDVTYNELLKHVEPQDLIKFGLVPELVGRLPIITTLETLDKSALLRILTEPKNSIVNQYKMLFKMDNITLEFENEALEAIADKAIARNTGARGLRSILESAMKNIMFTIPDIKDADRVVITKETINNNVKPIVYNKKNKEIA